MRFRSDYTFDSVFPALPAEHPERVLPIADRIAALSRVTLDDVRRFHTDFYGATSGTLSLVGDVDADSAGSLGRRLLGDWHSLVPPRPSVRVPPGRAVDTALIAAAASNRGVVTFGE